MGVRARAALAATFAVLFVTTVAGGDSYALSPNAGDTEQPAIARATSGEYLVAWRRFPGGILVQLYDSDGVPRGATRRLSPNGSADYWPAVAQLRDGGFLVVWNRLQSGTCIVGRVLDTSGVPRGVELVVSSNDCYGAPDVAINAKGQGLVTWSDVDGDSSGIFARRLRVDGSPRGASFRVNTHTAGQQGSPSVAAVRPLRFVVVWSDLDNRDGDDASIVAQRFNRIGVPVGGELLVNSYTTGRQYDPDVVGAGPREFVVVWEGGTSYGVLGPSGYDGFDARGIRGQRFGPGGSKVGDEFVVSSYEYGPHMAPSIDATEGDRYVVAWTQGGEYQYDFSSGRVGCGAIPGDIFDPGLRCQDGRGLGVVAQRLAADGSKLGNEQVVTDGGGRIDQHQGVVASTSPGRFVVAWTDAGCLGSENYTCRYHYDRSFIVRKAFDVEPE
jgi:hypothetical protein